MFILSLSLSFFVKLINFQPTLYFSEFILFFSLVQRILFRNSQAFFVHTCYFFFFLFKTWLYASCRASKTSARSSARYAIFFFSRLYTKNDNEKLLPSPPPPRNTRWLRFPALWQLFTTLAFIPALLSFRFFRAYYDFFFFFIHIIFFFFLFYKAILRIWFCRCSYLLRIQTRKLKKKRLPMSIELLKT